MTLSWKLNTSTSGKVVPGLSIAQHRNINQKIASTRRNNGDIILPLIQRKRWNQANHQEGLLRFLP